MHRLRLESGLTKRIAAGLLLLVLGSIGSASVAGCMPDRLYEPCSRSTHCEGLHDTDVRCVVSPFGGDSQGFCTVDCESRMAGTGVGDCVPNSECNEGETEGCCFINYVENLRGAGFCVPFPPNGGAEASE